VVLIVGLVVAAAVPLLTDRQDLLNLLFLVWLYITLAESWNVLGGFAGQVNLGHAAFFGSGALVTRQAWLGGQPLPLALVAGGLAALLFGLVVGVPTLRLRGVYFSMGTLAVAEALRITISNTMPLVSALPADRLADYDLRERYYLALGLAAAAVATAAILLQSRLSLGILAVREDEDAAQSTGVDAFRHKLMAVALSSFFAGLAGGAFAFHEVSLYPEAAFSPGWTFDAVLVTFVGGVGTLVGPIVGALFFIVVREQLAVRLVQVHQVIFGALFILIVLALPGGLVELWSRLRRTRSPDAPAKEPLLAPDS
jgi:branched-chain amino acid transport system permease protein